MITYENLNSIQNPTMNMIDEPTYIARAEAIIAEGHDVATAIENAVIDEHFDYIDAKEALERGRYDDIDGIYVTDEDGEIFVDIDDNVFTADHARELYDLAYIAYNDYLNDKAEMAWEAMRDYQM